MSRHDVYVLLGAVAAVVVTWELFGGAAAIVLALVAGLAVGVLGASSRSG